MTQVFVLLSKSKVHGVYYNEDIAQHYLTELRIKCGLVPGYDHLWKKDYRIETIRMDTSPFKQN